VSGTAPVDNTAQLTHWLFPSDSPDFLLLLLLLLRLTGSVKCQDTNEAKEETEKEEEVTRRVLLHCNTEISQNERVPTPSPLALVESVQLQLFSSLSFVLDNKNF